MINTSLEITENDYLIKFSRSKFDVSFIRNLLKIVEVSDQSDYRANADTSMASDLVLISPDYYSHLDDK